MHMQRVFTLMQRVQLHMQKDFSHMQKVLSLMQKDQKQKQLDIVPIVKEVKRQQVAPILMRKVNIQSLCEAAHAEGTATIANGFSSHAEGNHTSTAHFAGSHIMGRFGTADESYSWFIANGTNETDHNIGAKWLAHNGEMYIEGASYNASGTDFAQMFETVDNTFIDVGYFVTFSSEEKIRIATSNDSFILGISSATPALIGNSGALSWQKRYKTDSFGKRQYVRTESQDIQPLLNTEWDPACKYIARKDRNEWLPVGLIGQMLVRDDGTCETHGYCRPNNDGIATKSESGFFVIKRTGDNQILILFR